MNCLQQVRPAPEFAWYEERRVMSCKVYHDGHHFVAHRTSKLPYTRKASVPSDKDRHFDEVYYTSFKSGVQRKDLSVHIVSQMKEAYPEDSNLEEYVEARIETKKHNAYARRKRFYRKAYMNPWNYFVTFTYDDKLQTEESFRRRLHKCLQNFHTRRGWKYMGVFERAPETGRLHFHGLVYVPEGEMVGEVKELRDYSTKYKRMQVRHVNTFFEKTFGRNDFEPMDANHFSLKSTVNYVLKYMEKNDDPVTYSRGGPSEAVVEIVEDDVASEFLDYVEKMVIFDDVIDYEADVLKKGYRPDIDDLISAEMRC